MSQKENKPLKYGYTTGACATAATKAALTTLITKQPVTEITIKLPGGQDVLFQLKYCNFQNNCVITSVQKDGGDDPDATHGALIEAKVSWNEENQLIIDGGIGVGRVTKPGLPIPVGLAAINPVPRQMIKSEVASLLYEFNIDRGVTVIISVPDGEKIAKKTLNGRLGIVGGISILGTRGIVVPFSNEAYKESIVSAIKVAKAMNCEHVVITTGGRSEKYAMKQYPFLKEEAFIEMGDFVGFTLEQCQQFSIRKVTIVGMLGKLSKLAYGSYDVHSKRSKVSFSFLAKLAKEVGANEATSTKILNANTASQVGEIITEAKLNRFFTILCERCCNEAVKMAQSDTISIETYLFTLDGFLLGKAKLNDE